MNRLIGELQGRLGAHESRFDALEAANTKRFDAIEAKIDKLLETLAAGKGGWRAVMIMGSIVVSIAGMIAWVADHIVYDRPGIERSNP